MVTNGLVLGALKNSKGSWVSQEDLRGALQQLGIGLDDRRDCLGGLGTIVGLVWAGRLHP